MEIREHSEIYQLVRGLPKNSRQINGLFESDCEIVKLAQSYLCASTDSVGEEINLGLYKNPFLWGWMTVMASVSDLSVSGANPIGLLLSNQWSFDTPDETKKEFFRGAKAALKRSKVALLGGDSGYATGHVHTSTILGESKIRPLTRLGVKIGDYVALLGRKKTGEGPALAFRYLFQHPEDFFPEENFRPEAFPRKITPLRPWISAGIDTSDGVASSLNIIGELNHAGFQLQYSDKLFSAKALEFCSQAHIHPLMLWMGDHGDFQALLFIKEKFIQKALKKEKDLFVIGRVTREKGCKVQIKNKNIEMPIKKVTDCPRDLKSIFKLAQTINSYFWAEDPSESKDLQSKKQKGLSTK